MKRCDSPLSALASRRLSVVGAPSPASPAAPTPPAPPAASALSTATATASAATSALALCATAASTARAGSGASWRALLPGRRSPLVALRMLHIEDRAVLRAPPSHRLLAHPLQLARVDVEPIHAQAQAGLVAGRHRPRDLRQAVGIDRRVREVQRSDGRGGEEGGDGRRAEGRLADRRVVQPQLGQRAS